MTPRDWLLDLINDNGHLAWVRVPVASQHPLDIPALRIYWDRSGQDGELYLLVSHPALPQVYAPEDIPTMRPVWDEVLRWEAA